MTDQKNDDLPDECKKAFEHWLSKKSLSAATDEDAWGQEIYKYPKIEAMWYAWKGVWNTRAQPVADDAGGDQHPQIDGLDDAINNSVMYPMVNEVGFRSESDRRLVMQAARRYLAITTTPPAADNRHKWDADGERCVECGDKDWMNDPACRPKPPADNRGVDVEATLSEFYKTEAIGNITVGEDTVLRIFYRYLNRRGLLRTTPEDAKGDEWQPIETAPRDKVFCVWMPFGTMYTQCRWREDRGCAENHFGLLPEATHWTIPHGPTTQQPEREGE